jgi:hypothetical protein
VPKPDRKMTPGYIFFYLLFSADTWRVLCGVIGAVLLTPRLAEGRQLGQGAMVILALMLVAIGWWVTAWPMARWAAFLRQRIFKLGGR